MAQESWKKETEETECQTPEGRIFCANNCGFFGSTTTNNLCSKCYRDLFMKQKQQQLMASPVIPIAQKGPSSSASCPVPLEPVYERLDKVEERRGMSSEQGPSIEEVSKQPPNRCLSCRKRVGLTGFKCRCGGMFCSVHRYSEMHECSYDYRSAGRDAIAKANPVVKAQKIQRI